MNIVKPNNWTSTVMWNAGLICLVSGYCLATGLAQSGPMRVALTVSFLVSGAVLFGMKARQAVKDAQREDEGRLHLIR